MSEASLIVAILLAVIYWSERGSHGSDRGAKKRGYGDSAILGVGCVSLLLNLLRQGKRRGVMRLGTTITGHKYLAPSDSLLVFGPTRSGKTLTLALPLLCEFAGPAVVTSIKRDLYARSSPARGKMGETRIFDLSDPDSSSWNLFSLVDDLRSAKEISDSLCAVSRATNPEIEFWSRLASKMLAPLLLAAKELGASLAEMVRWVEVQDFEGAFEALSEAGHYEARSALDAVTRLDERAVSSVVATLFSLMEPYNDPLVSSLLSIDGIDLPRMLDRNDSCTLYICSPLFKAERFYGVYEVFLRRVFEIAYSSAANPKILFLLDEIANIAPISDLGKIASTCGGYGLVLVSVFQDLAQLSAIYGANAGTIVNNHRSKLLLSGISDHATLDYVERIHAWRNERETALNPLLELKIGYGLLLQANAKPIKLRLRPFPR